MLPGIGSSTDPLQLLSLPSQISVEAATEPWHAPHVPSGRQVCEPPRQTPTLGPPQICVSPGAQPEQSSSTAPSQSLSLPSQRSTDGSTASAQAPQAPPAQVWVPG